MRAAALSAEQMKCDASWSRCSSEHIATKSSAPNIKRYDQYPAFTPWVASHALMKTKSSINGPSSSRLVPSGHSAPYTRTLSDPGSALKSGPWIWSIRVTVARSWVVCFLNVADLQARSAVTGARSNGPRNPMVLSSRGRAQFMARTAICGASTNAQCRAAAGRFQFTASMPRSCGNAYLSAAAMPIGEPEPPQAVSPVSIVLIGSSAFKDELQAQFMPALLAALLLAWCTCFRLNVARVFGQALPARDLVTRRLLQTGSGPGRSGQGLPRPCVPGTLLGLP
ncbi:Uncharacterised protein [Mycobacteroides abscessus subsp. massiliense]|nr:Uncharacterised protein [Mycobacteroides abscessus subsp. massiliense]